MGEIPDIDEDDIAEALRVMCGAVFEQLESVYGKDDATRLFNSAFGIINDEKGRRLISDDDASSLFNRLDGARMMLNALIQAGAIKRG